MILIGDMLGVAPEDRDDLLRWSDDMVSAQSGSATDEQYVQAMNAMTEYTGFCTHAIAQRQETPTDDLMSVLVHAEVDGDRLGPDDVLHESLLILVGGDETTRHVISGGMEQLLLHPEQRALLQDDPTKIPVAVEEMLRWVSPIKNMCRTVTHDTEFMGQPLVQGQKCMLLYESANRDEKKFDEPHRFDVERTPNEHVAFGFGAHFCLGQALARLELTVMFEQLLTRLPDLELAGDPSTFPRRRANFISGLESMPRPVHSGRAARSEPGVNNRDLIAQFWTDLYARDWDKVATYFGNDSEYTDMPTPPEDVARGAAQIVARLKVGLEPLASIGDVLVARRLRGRHGRSPNTSSTGSGAPARRAALPFVSMQELRDGVIVRWWDYWDMGTLMGSAPAWWVEHIMEAAAAAGLGER